MFKRLVTLLTHRIYNLPVLVLMPHSRCNCRCVMCDIWKANNNKKEISAEDLQKHIEVFARLGVREIVFSGGEALMHSNLWKLCLLIKSRGIKITLLSTGLLLQKNANEVVEHIDEVIVSVDGSRNVHDKIRNIPEGFKKLSDGIEHLKSLKKNYRITARCVLQRHNYFDFNNIVTSAKEIGLDQISFLAADISTSAFNREEHWDKQRVSDVALTKEETFDFEKIIEQSFIDLASEYTSSYIAERPSKMRKIVQYYKAINGISDYPETICNAPWVSAVIESDGNVMPCFFHKPYGNIYENNFLDIINSSRAVSFRKQLDIKSDEVCSKCVCSLRVGITQLN